MPMQIFTREDELKMLFGAENMKPSEKTLQLIRQIAYTYRAADNQAYCIN